MGTTLIGPLGGLVEVRTPATPVEVSHGRPSSQMTLASGGRVLLEAPLSRRRWEWRIPWGSPDDVAGLLALASGHHGPGPWRWYDPMAAAWNLLPVEVASPAGALWLGSEDDEVVLSSSFPRTVSAAGPLTFPRFEGRVDPVPTVVGRSYTASLRVAGGTSTDLRLRWVDAAGATVSTSSAGSEDGDRWSVSEQAPGGAAGLLVQVETDGDWWEPQVVEGAGPVVWRPGRGCPHVHVEGLAEVYRLVAGGRVAEDVQVSLVEVDPS